MTDKEAKNIKTEEIQRLLVDRFSLETGRYTYAFEVSNSTGTYASRRLDFVAMECWPSDGWKISAFEIKVSKSDFRHELTSPEKHNVFFEDIDNYSIVAPDYVLDDNRIIPPKWGIYHVVRNKDGGLEMKTVRKPLSLHDEAVAKRRLGRGFVASFIRAMNKQTIARLLNMERQKYKEQAEREIEERIAKGRVISSWDYDELQRLRKISHELRLPSWTDRMTDDDKKRFRTALDIMDRAHIVDRSVATVESNVRALRKSVKGLLDIPAQEPEGNSEASKTSNGLSPSDIAQDVSERCAASILAMEDV